PATPGAGTTRAPASTTARALRRRRRFGKRRTSVGRQASCHREGTVRRMEGRDHRPMVPVPTSTGGRGGGGVGSGPVARRRPETMSRTLVDRDRQVARLAPAVGVDAVGLQPGAAGGA